MALRHPLDEAEARGEHGAGVEAAFVGDDGDVVGFGHPDRVRRGLALDRRVGAPVTISFDMAESLCRRVARDRCSGRQGGAQRLLAARREDDDARILRPLRPAQCEETVEQGRAERAAEVMAALAPVEARAAERAPPLRGQRRVDAERGEAGGAGVGEEQAAGALGEPAARDRPS